VTQQLSHRQQLRQFLADCGIEVTPDELRQALKEVAINESAMHDMEEITKEDAGLLLQVIDDHAIAHYVTRQIVKGRSLGRVEKTEKALKGPGGVLDKLRRIAGVPEPVEAHNSNRTFTNKTSTS